MYDLVQVAFGNSAIAAGLGRDAEQAWGAVHISGANMPACSADVRERDRRQPAGRRIDWDVARRALGR